MNRVLTFALAFSTALAGVASAQAGPQSTTKPNPKTAANASARRVASPTLTLSNNPVTRAVRKVAAAIGFGDSEPERVATPAPRRIAAANNPTVQSTSRPVATTSANPNASRAASPTSAITRTTTPAKPAVDPRKGAVQGQSWPDDRQNARRGHPTESCDFHDRRVRLQSSGASADSTARFD